MKTFEEWIIIANKTFNNKYKYNKIFKKDKYNFFEIVCETHGIFEKKIQNHILKQQGCSLCSKPSRLTNNLFIDKATKIHGDKYDYTQVEYKNGNTKIKIICKEHGIFVQLPQNHLKGQNCPICSNRFKFTNEIFIEKAQKIHGNKYGYAEINYINNQTKIKILCKEHGYFNQIPMNHLKGNQCYKCSNIVKTNDDFIAKANIIHKNMYIYDKTNYKSARKKVIIECTIHGEFTQSPNDHLNGCGCQRCSIL
uniref:Uncharacterized protein n=1 Tax=viral metagenome TaxID=1070528 RepID=A0A6C0HMM5_9ZZZZ